uniref:Uncharacterized protein n=1 Tax=Acrobeloides nanus TaxID=290746 RepID=A0A914D7C2_9BILA
MLQVQFYFNLQKQDTRWPIARYTWLLADTRLAMQRLVATSLELSTVIVPRVAVEHGRIVGCSPDEPLHPHICEPRLSVSKIGVESSNEDEKRQLEAEDNDQPSTSAPKILINIHDHRKCMRSRKGFAIIRRFECAACAEAKKKNGEKYMDKVVPEIFVANAAKIIRTNPDKSVNGGHFCDRDLYK